MRSRYKTNDGTEAFYDEADTAFSGQNAGFDVTDGILRSGNAGMGTTAQSWC